MTVTTKFDVGDIAWYMYQNKPTEIIISSCVIYCPHGSNELRVIYTAYDKIKNGNWLDHHIHECMMFNSKEELLKSL